MLNTAISVKPFQRHGRRIVWRQRYDGVVTIAYRNGHAIAGISGPWSDRFVLTWWSYQFSDSSLELFDSLEAAKLAVLGRVREQRSDRLNHPPVLHVGTQRASRRFSWLEWLRALFGRAESRKFTQIALEMRRNRMCEAVDLSGIHFDAYR
jgi:hypothetical protein